MLLLPPPSSLVPVGSEPEPVPVEVKLLPEPTSVTEDVGVPAEVELLVGSTMVAVFIAVPITSGSPIAQPHQKTILSVGQEEGLTTNTPSHSIVVNLVREKLRPRRSV